MKKDLYPPTVRDGRQPSDMTYRILNVRLSNEGTPLTLDKQLRSFEVIGATESPVEVFDYERLEVVTEILLMDGCEMPERRQVPLLDTHIRGNSASVLGSYREMRVERDQLVGRVYFSNSADAESTYIKASEGHLTDFSVGYRVIDSQWVPAGEKATIRGRSFEGPVRVTTRWRVKELSICPIGADEAAKARNEANLFNHQTKEKKPMDPRLRSYLESRGLAKDADEIAAWAFLTELQNQSGGDRNADAVRATERERIISIETICERAGRPELANGFIQDGTSLDTVRNVVMDFILNSIQDGGGYGHRKPIDLVVDETDKRVGAQCDGLLLRAGLPVPLPSPGADEFRSFSLLDHARECLKARGRSAKGSADRIIREAMRTRAMMTGDLPTILGNFAEKTVLIGFEEAQAPIVATAREIPARDFKTQYLVKLSEADDLLEVPDKAPFKYSSFEEHGESIALATYGRLFAVTRHSIVNDDLGLLGGIGRAHGNAAARRVRDCIVSVITSNGVMSDNLTLFHEDHNNVAEVEAMPNSETLKEGFKKMKLQTGPNGAILGIAPKFLIVPIALEVDSWQLLESTGELASEKSAGVKNPWYGRLMLVPEPALDAYSPSEWYLSCDPNLADGLVVAYLNGNKQPFLDSREGWTVDGVEYKVRLDVAAAAADWRGLYHNGGEQPEE